MRAGGTHGARMKSEDRCRAKTDVRGDYGLDALKAEGIEKQEPNCRYLKDVLRCTLLLSSHEALGAAHAALIAKYTPVSTKDRRHDLARDVLQTVWYQGRIVEVQFHFAAVVGLKKFSHVAYNITRVQTKDLASVNGTLVDIPLDGLDKYTVENVPVTSWLHFE